MNPLSLPGPAFLALWMLGAFVVAGITYGVRAVIAGRRASTTELEALEAGLHPIEVAYLAGGLERAIEAAIAGLVHSGALVVEDGVLRTIETAKQPPSDGGYRGGFDKAALSPVERYVLAQVRCDRSATVASLIYAADGLDAQLGDRLRTSGLLLAVPPGLRAWVYAPGVLWLGLGFTKLCVGLTRDRPVGFLAILLVAGTVALACLRLPPRTTRGEQLLRWVKGGAYGLEATSTTAPQQLSGSDLALAYALFGVQTVGASLALLMPSHQRALAATTASAAGSSCGSSCGGGCGGGCGGCS